MCKFLRKKEGGREGREIKKEKKERKKEEQNYHVTQPYSSWVDVQRTLHLSTDVLVYPLEEVTAGLADNEGLISPVKGGKGSIPGGGSRSASAEAEGLLPQEIKP